MIERALAFVLSYALFTSTLFADEILFEQAQQSGETLRISLSTPHPNKATSKPSTEKNAGGEQSQTWQADLVSADGKSLKPLYEEERLYLMPGVIVQGADRVLAARPVGDGILVIRADYGDITGWLYSKTYTSSDTRNLLLQVKGKSVAETGKKSHAVISGGLAQNNLSVVLTLPDGKTHRFKLVFRGNDFHWEEPASSPLPKPTTQK